MSQTNYHRKDEDDTVLPLPDEAGFGVPEKIQSEKPNPAADLIRKRIEAVYAQEPSAKEEIAEVKELKSTTHRSRHQQFVYELMNSGKPMHEIQMAWHEYYSGLPDKEKHAVWQEFYDSHKLVATYHHEPRKHSAHDTVPASLRTKKHVRKLAQKLSSTKEKVLPLEARHKLGWWQNFQSLLFGLGVGCIVIFIVLFSFFNERFIAPFIQPSRTVSNTPIIIADSSTVGANPEVIIPKINVEVPVVYGMASTDPEAVQTALENGVLHYADTAQPGEDGNVVIVGHSAVNVFNAGKYKFAFILLHKLEVGDTFYLQKDGKRFAYQVYDKEIVKPSDVGVLAPRPDQPATATLITCDPPGYNANRMVVVGKQISPDPSSNLAAQQDANKLAAQTAVVPGNSQSLWSRLTSWL